MNELPIVILSKQLKYSLATDKVKTLEKAIELLPRLSQQEAKKKTIQSLANKYNALKANAAHQFNLLYKNNSINSNQNAVTNKNANTTQSMEIQSTQQINKNSPKTAQPLYKLLFGKSICEIFGAKGSGKTCLLLHLAQKYGQVYKQQKKRVKIVILNCVSGITHKRMQKLQKLKQQGMSIQCLQIGFIEQITKTLQKIRNQLKQDPSKKIFIAIDMMVLLLMTKQKSKIYINQIFKYLGSIVQKHSCTVLFTNFVQHKFQVGNQELYNHASYYCQSMAEYLTHKIYLQRPDKNSAGRFKLINIKGPKIQAFFTIQATGLQQIKFIQNNS